MKRDDHHRLLEVLDTLAPAAVGPSEAVLDSFIGFVPIWRGDVRLRLTYRKPIGPLPEFALRFISADCNQRESLKDHLAVPDAMFIRLMDHLLDEEWVRRIPSVAPSYEVTPTGSKVLEQLETTAELERTITLDVDPVDGSVNLFDEELVGGSEIPRDDNKCLVLPAARRSNLDLGALNAKQVRDQIVAVANRELGSEMARGPGARGPRLSAFDSVVVEQVVETQAVFKRVPVLMIADLDSDTGYVRVCRGWDFKESSAHTRFLVETLRDGEFPLDVTVPTSPRIPIKGIDSAKLSEMVKENLRRAAEIQKKASSIEELKKEERQMRSQSGAGLGFALGAALADKVKSAIEQKSKEVKELQKGIKTEIRAGNSAFRVLTAAEHRAVLERALDSARQRVVIVSPWLRTNAINGRLVERLLAALHRQVRVTIGYGIDDVDDAMTQRALGRLQKAKEAGLVIKRLGDTHEKILLCDDKFAVITSFNWLSFRPWEGHAVRHETGLYTEDPATIASLSQMLESRLKAR